MAFSCSCYFLLTTADSINQNHWILGLLDVLAVCPAPEKIQVKEQKSWLSSACAQQHFQSFPPLPLEHRNIKILPALGLPVHVYRKIGTAIPRDASLPTSLALTQNVLSLLCPRKKNTVSSSG